MPRGQRKRSQYTCTVWTPGGARLEYSSTQELTLAQYAESLRYLAGELQKFADLTEKKKPELADAVRR